MVNRNKFMSNIIAIIICILFFLLTKCIGVIPPYVEPPVNSYTVEELNEDIPEYNGSPYVYLNNNTPSFTEEDLSAKPYESYSSLDDLGRCGAAEAMLDVSLMPTEERGSIGSVKPTGWHTVKYDVIPDRYLYNRCHLIGYQLAGENANVKNLITGTRYLNVTGMLPWENLVDDYIEETNDKVLYRVTPVFVNNELVARGVIMEGQSISSDTVKFNIFVYNVQPGVVIDYATGDSHLA